MRGLPTPRSREPPDGGEETVHLVRRERRGRLVHDQQPRARRERLRDLEQLPVGDAEPSYGRVGIDVYRRARSRMRAVSARIARQSTVRDARADGGRRRRSRPPSDPRKTVGSWYIATMPSAMCGLRVADPPRRAVDHELALVGMDDAGHDLHERRLAGAVLADERVTEPERIAKLIVGDRLDAAVASRTRAARTAERPRTAPGQRDCLRRQSRVEWIQTGRLNRINPELVCVLMALDPVITISDVADRAKVSVGTVSNVVNRPERVAEDTRNRVQEAIAALGWVPYGSAATLRAGRATLVGLIVPDIRNPFFTEVARRAPRIWRPPAARRSSSAIRIGCSQTSAAHSRRSHANACAG